MLQRMQSVYLAVVFVLILGMFFLPLAIFFDGSGNYYLLLYKGMVKITLTGGVPVKQMDLLILFIMGSLLMTLTGIFLYRNRKIQIKACYYLMVILFLFTCYLCYSYFLVPSQLKLLNAHLKFSSVFPLISIMLVFLAINAIRKDDALVKSIDRIR
jgi:hypothetical protein